MDPYITGYHPWVSPAWVLFLGVLLLLLSLPRLITSLPVDGVGRRWGIAIATSLMAVLLGVALTSWGLIALQWEEKAQFPPVDEVARHYGLMESKSDGKGTAIEWRHSRGERFHDCSVRSIPLGDDSYKHVLLCTSVKTSQVVDFSG